MSIVVSDSYLNQGLNFSPVPGGFMQGDLEPEEHLRSIGTFHTLNIQCTVQVADKNCRAAAGYALLTFISS
jgi:hypothetical protein